MSPVKSALQKLEISVAGLERSLLDEQPDMFAPPSNQNATKRIAPTIDTAIVGQKIDNAIDKVEALLREG